ncbi:hypothetical protein M0805_007100 [Coniferiporia weirii]|nr:hypothetical protein M0805_007100 [Coniferiporia weirii]
MATRFLTLFLSASLLTSSVRGASNDLAAQLGLTTSTALPFPSATMSASDATAYMGAHWALQGGISFGKDALWFVEEPFGGSSGFSSPSSSPLPSSSESGSGLKPKSNNVSGTNSSDGSDGPVFAAMLLSYDIAFDSDFDWVKGGKLPGLRGGPKLDSCSGGREPTGSDCFSSRLMWRKDGAGEVYAYVPSQPSLCNVDDIICNNDYGFSFGRGKYTFSAGKWQNVAVYSKMNDPPSASNGEIALYFNGEQIFSFTDIKFRTSTDVTAGGMYFSTFFGGSDSSWATPKTVHTYFRNFQMFGGAGTGGGLSSSGTNSTTPSSESSTSSRSSSSSSSHPSSTKSSD